MSLRINRSEAAGADDWKKFLERLVKLIPGEALSLFTFVGGLGGDSMQAIWPWVFLVLTAVVRFFATKDKDNNTQWTAVIVSTIAFFLWVFVTGGTFAGIPLPSGAVTVPVMKGVSALYVFVVPYFYKGD